MEKSKRSIFLLIAFIIGICFLAFFAIAYCNLFSEKFIVGNYIFYKYENDPDSKIGDYQLMKADALKHWEENGGTLGYIKISGWKIWFYICMPILIVSAIVFNIFAWLKNENKKTIISAILYLIGLNIPSAVLCFIGFSKLKRKNISEN